jgi:hypothetical protein
MRMGMRRFTRLNNGFSKKVENLAHAVSLHFTYYNFARPTRRSRKPTTAGRQRLLWLPASKTVSGQSATPPPYSTSALR